nr:MAG TPA: hypothetical protein [Herelleviridae sp.]
MAWWASSPRPRRCSSLSGSSPNAAISALRL